MRYNNLILGLGLTLASHLAAGSARADIPPAGSCAANQAGQTCDDPVDKDGNDVPGPGTCVEEECTRGTPDGTVEYECVMCRATPDPGAGGAGEAPVKPDPSAGKAGSSATTKDDDGEGGGCSLGRANASSGALTGAAALLLLGWVQRRRRNTRG